MSKDSEGPCLECSCGEEKAVCELLLVEKGCLGKDVDNSIALKSLTKREQFKLDHVMGALFGFNTSQLQNKEAIKAGLLEKAAELQDFSH